nr:MAG TPA: hypothetical protein [Caudoviricetes sp.]
MSSIDSLLKTIISPREKLMMELSKKKGQLLALTEGRDNPFSTPLYAEMKLVEEACDGLSSKVDGKLFEVMEGLGNASDDPLDCLPDMEHKVTSIASARSLRKVEKFTKRQIQTASSDIKRRILSARQDAIGIPSKEQFEAIKSEVTKKYPEALLAVSALSQVKDISKKAKDALGSVRGLGSTDNLIEQIQTASATYLNLTPERLKDDAITKALTLLEGKIKTIGELVSNYRRNVSQEKEHALKTISNHEEGNKGFLKERISGSYLLDGLTKNQEEQDASKEESKAGNTNQITRIEGVCLCDDPDKERGGSASDISKNLEPSRYEGILVEVLKEVDDFKWLDHKTNDGTILQTQGVLSYTSPIENPTEDKDEEDRIASLYPIPKDRFRCYKGSNQSHFTVPKTLQDEIEKTMEIFSEVQDAKQAIIAFAIPMVYPNIALGVRLLVGSRIRLGFLRKLKLTPASFLNKALEDKEHKKKGYDKTYFDRVKKMEIDKRIKASDGDEQVIAQVKDDTLQVVNDHYNRVVREYMKLRSSRKKIEDSNILRDMNKHLYIPMLERVNRKEEDQLVYPDSSKVFKTLRQILQDIIANRAKGGTLEREVIDAFNNEELFRLLFVGGMTDEARDKWIIETTRRRKGKAYLENKELQVWRSNESIKRDKKYNPYTLFELISDECVNDEGKERTDKQLLKEIESIVSNMGLRLTDNFSYALEHDFLPLFKAYRKRYIEAITRLLAQEANTLNSFFDECIATVAKGDERISKSLSSLASYSNLRGMPAPIELTLGGKVYQVYQIGKAEILDTNISSPLQPSNPKTEKGKGVTFLDRAYWVRHFALDTLCNVTPDRWVTWIILPAFTLKLPVIYLAIIPIKIGHLLLVFGIGIAGLGTNLCLLVINTSNKDLSYLTPLTLALNKVYEEIKRKAEEASDTATSSVSQIEKKASREAYEAKKSISEMTDKVKGLDREIAGSLASLKETIAKVNTANLHADSLSKCDRLLKK